MSTHKRTIAIIMTLMAFLVLPAIIQAGQLTPSAPPAPTMKSLDELYQKMSVMENKINTLQTIITKGQRFIDNNNGTVTDAVTGLIWLKNANPCGGKTGMMPRRIAAALPAGRQD
jgi:hypothetical protein